MDTEGIREVEPMTRSESDKLIERMNEWNAIYPFIEWLQENKMCIAVWHDPRAPNINSYTVKTGTIKENAEHPLEHPHPYGQPIDNLLYEYFDVDPAKLKREQREQLESLWVGGAG